MPARRRPARLRRHGAAAAVLLLATVPVLAACGTGSSAYTAQQQASGNGAFAQQGPLAIANVTLVAGPEGSRSATLIGNVTNVGGEPDALTGVAILEPAATGQITGDEVPVLPRAFDPISLGYDPAGLNPDGAPHVNFFDLDLPLSHFVPVGLSFKNAGDITLPNVLVVPPVGQYEGIAPSPAPSA